MNFRRLPYRNLAWTAGIVLCLLLALQVLLPVVANSRAVRSIIIARASDSFSAEVDFKKISPGLFPRPHAVMHGGRAERTDSFRVRFAQAVFYPKFWPLIKGRLAVARLSITKPEIAIGRHLKAPGSSRQRHERTAFSASEQFHQALAWIADLPDLAQIEVFRGRLLLTNDGPESADSLQIDDLDLSIEQEKLELGEFQFRIHIAASSVRIQRGSRPLTLKGLVLEGDAHGTAQQGKITFSQVQITAPRIQLDGSANWSTISQPSGTPFQLTLDGTELDLTEIRAALLQLAGDVSSVRNFFDIVQGGRILSFSTTLGPGNWSSARTADSFQLTCRLVDGRIAVPDDLLTLEEVSGDVRLSHGKLSADHIRARTGNTRSQNGTLELGLWDGSKAFVLDIDLVADLADLPAVLQKLPQSQEATELLDRLPTVSGQATGKLLLGDRLDRIRANINTNARINVLDADLDLSGTIKGIPAATTETELSLSGDLGPRAIQWLGQAVDLPAQWRPVSALEVVDARLTRDPAGLLELSGDFSTATGVRMDVQLKIQDNGVHLEKMHLLDPPSNALFAYRHVRKSSQWDAAFNGSLHKATVNKLWRNDILSGWVKGDLKVHIDTVALDRSSLQGRLEGAQIDLPLHAPGRMRVLKASLEGREKGFMLSSAVVKWQDHTARVSGRVAFDSRALDLDLKASTDALNVDQLVQAFKADPIGPRTQPSSGATAFKVRGKVNLKASQADFKGYRFEPLQAEITLMENQTTVDVTRANTCGIGTPGEIRISPEGLQLEFKPHAIRIALRDTDICLADTQITERLEGNASIAGRIATSGKGREEWTRNLSGELDIQIADGRVYNSGAAGFFTNLLSFISVNQLIQGGLPDLRRNDFHYKAIESKLALKDGLLRIEEGILKSNSVNIVANGDYNLASKNLDLVLLVSPLTTVDWIVERIPLLGHILQGTLVAIPVGVKGPLANPAVVPLSPSAVGARLGGILERTVETPFRILSPLLKDDSQPDH